MLLDEQVCQVAIDLRHLVLQAIYLLSQVGDVGLVSGVLREEEGPLLGEFGLDVILQACLRDQRVSVEAPELLDVFQLEAICQVVFLFWGKV